MNFLKMDILVSL
uniref:Uncharacterized protein n=1 Tax=Arundo donax TaxID=35708 RepID=A0A0A9AEH2_ARUDO